MLTTPRQGDRVGGKEEGTKEEDEEEETVAETTTLRLEIIFLRVWPEIPRTESQRPDVRRTESVEMGERAHGCSPAWTNGRLGSKRLPVGWTYGRADGNV